MIFVPDWVVHHESLLLNNFLVGGMLLQWNMSSLGPQLLGPPNLLLTETVGQTSSRSSWTRFIQQALSMETCGMQISFAKKAL